MNILHLLSQTHLTGAEVYSVTLAHEQLESGHHVIQVSNAFHMASRAPQFKLNVECGSKIEFIRNVFWLRNFLQKQNIQVVHSHSRAAAKLAFYATIFTDVAHISTVHGVQHPSFSKRLLNQYGQMQIAVSDNIKKQIVADFNYNPDRIRVIPNPIDASRFGYSAKDPIVERRLRVAIIGRGTGPKGERTRQCLQALANARVSELVESCTVIGATAAELGVTVNSTVSFEDAPELNALIYSRFDVVIGSGRVAMEALFCGVPCIAFGESAYEGLVSEANFSQAAISNFGDIVPGTLHPQLREEDLIADFRKVLSFSEGPSLAQKARSLFALPAVSSRVMRAYESAFFLKNYSRWIPCLMYHKIPKTEIQSQHKIFVTADNFEKHLRFFKSRGFTALTFSELALYRKGQLNFNTFPKKPLILTFDDGYRDNLENASPLLKKYGFRAQLFLLADSTVKENSWDTSEKEPAHEIVAGSERKAWRESAFEIGSHGFRHRKITDLSDADAVIELAESKKSLERELNCPVNVFAFTYGITDSRCRHLAESCGYDYAVNTDSGGMLLEEDPYAIFRVNIFPDENRWSLFKKTCRWYRHYYKFKRGK